MCSITKKTLLHSRLGKDRHWDWNDNCSTIKLTVHSGLFLNTFFYFLNRKIFNFLSKTIKCHHLYLALLINNFLSVVVIDFIINYG